MATAVSGATVWAKLTASNLTGTGNPFGAQLLHVRDQRTSGTASDTYNNGSWYTRHLQTSVTNEISSASLSSNQISLPSGTYFIEAFIGCLAGTASSKVSFRLRNTTDSTTILVSVGNRAANVSGGSGLIGNINGRFTLSGTKTLEIQTYSDIGSTTGGAAQSTGEVEVYADVLIWKVA